MDGQSARTEADDDAAVPWTKLNVYGRGQPVPGLIPAIIRDSAIPQRCHPLHIGQPLAGTINLSKHCSYLFLIPNMGRTHSRREEQLGFHWPVRADWSVRLERHPFLAAFLSL